MPRVWQKVDNSMPRVHDLIRAHLLASVGGVEPPAAPVPLEAVRARNAARLATFEAYRQNRLGFGFYRYEINGTRPHRNVESCLDRLRAYLADGNLEHLVDVANLCAIEFTCPGSHPSPRWAPVDDGAHVAVTAPSKP